MRWGKHDFGSMKRKKASEYLYDSGAFVLAVRTGLEPATPGVTGRYSNQLNYRTIVQTFEPMEGIEPTTPRLQITCSGQLSYIGNVVPFSQRGCKYSTFYDTTYTLLITFFSFCTEPSKNRTIRRWSRRLFWIRHSCGIHRDICLATYRDSNDRL